MNKHTPPAAWCRIEALRGQIKSCEADIANACAAIAEIKSAACNNVYDSLEEAAAYIEDALRVQASDDCEGSHCRGLDEYHQLFMVGSVTYKATLACESDRYDKTYHYVDQTVFSIEVVQA